MLAQSVISRLYLPSKRHADDVALEADLFVVEHAERHLLADFGDAGGGQRAVVGVGELVSRAMKVQAIWPLSQLVGTRRAASRAEDHIRGRGPQQAAATVLWLPARRRYDG